MKKHFHAIILLFCNLLLLQGANLSMKEADSTPLNNRKPLLLIHGWSYEGIPGPPWYEAWNNLLAFYNSNAEFKAAYKPYVVNYFSNVVTVKELGTLLKNKVDSIYTVNPEFAAQKFTIIAHSMGGLVARSFMNENSFNNPVYNGISCGDKLERLLTLSTPHHGTHLANGPARDDKAAVTDWFAIQMVEYMLEVEYDQKNRTCMHWDNYNNHLNYTLYPDESNPWLINLNSIEKYRNRMILYYAKVIIEQNGPKGLLDAPANVLDGMGYASDGIVPVKSSTLEGYDGFIAVRGFDGYDHEEILSGKSGERIDSVIFAQIKTDLLMPSAIAGNDPEDRFSAVLHGNYPNPFNNSTCINYSIRNAQQVKLQIYDHSGRIVATLINQQLRPGEYSVVFNADKLSSGVYFCRLTTANSQQTSKLILVK